MRAHSCVCSHVLPSSAPERAYGGEGTERLYMGFLSVSVVLGVEPGASLFLAVYVAMLLVNSVR